jgi:hypothetical protein
MKRSLAQNCGRGYDLPSNVPILEAVDEELA